MRPLKLTMQAFGPYASTELIDFTKLSNRTMFVISGKTGSGKTTIFDGISYAIYGKASGEDRNGPDLRSQFAKNDLLTEVSLEFALRNKTYFITRSPQQEKKKDRGDGYTTISAKAELYIYDKNGDKQLLAANIRDVDEKIKEIMIIDSNQFRQILMIPQGEFRKLLTSESKEKEVILQRLFHTQIYKRIEEKLKENAVELKRTVDTQIENRNQSMQQIQAHYNEELQAYLGAGSINDQIIMPLLKSEINLMEGELAQLSNRLKEKQENRDSLQQKLYEAEAIVKQLMAKEDLVLKKAKLEEEKENFSQVERLIILAQKAAVLAQQEELCHHLKKELDISNHELSALQTRKSILSVQLHEQEVRLEEEKVRENERELLADEIRMLENMREDIQSFSIINNEAHIIEKRLETLKNEKEKIADFLTKSGQALIILLEEKQQLEKDKLLFLENASKLEKIEDEIVRFDKFEELKTRYEKELNHFEQRKGYLENILLRLEDGKKMIDHLEQKWLHGQAGILASKLLEGDSCPVCGSLHHPNPAVLTETIPNDKDLKSAKRQVEEVEKEKAKAESDFYESQSNVRSVKDALNSLLADIQKHRVDLIQENFLVNKSLIVTERNDLAKVQSSLSKRIERMPSCLKELEYMEKNKENYSINLQKLIDQMNEATILYTEKKTNLTRMTEKIPVELRSMDVFEDRLFNAMNKHDNLIKRFESANQSFQDTKGKFLAETAKYEIIEKQAAKKKEDLANEREAFVQRMKNQGFESYSEFNGAKKSENEIKMLENSLRNYREEVRSVNDRYEELSKLLKDVEKPDLEKLNDAYREIEKHISQLQEEYTNLFIKKRQNEDIVEKITIINGQIKDLEEKYKIIGHLYEITKGQNTYRITFERFVLAAFLDDILREANGRLSKMTSGRYELLRKTNRSKGNVQSGLELLVFDQYTGQERHVKTLSGGESFKAALALALGLADVVQQFAGGVSLETMFIDEGFGTLDPESLDQAIEALMEIQNSGRLVGIISHVPELKERIDARLEVYASQTGSQTEFQFS
ncbi:AAA family ATPase [Bacillus sp. FJAT-49705]|uniref:Nuclease SbcCD subunit C n=1 Tax=Cytobacillus citreus TaxID=2833586 RepID=A0ABS5NNF6_9BACI|nr:AAA family ATPase [Cytobacillus citreus]MBS4189361.1 AAA family ATPase [Cytobacillus citreus]